VALCPKAKTKSDHFPSPANSTTISCTCTPRPLDVRSSPSRINHRHGLAPHPCGRMCADGSAMSGTFTHRRQHQQIVLAAQPDNPSRRSRGAGRDDDGRGPCLPRDPTAFLGDPMPIRSRIVAVSQTFGPAAGLCGQRRGVCPLSLAGGNQSQLSANGRICLVFSLKGQLGSRCGRLGAAEHCRRRVRSRTGSTIKIGQQFRVCLLARAAPGSNAGLR